MTQDNTKYTDWFLPILVLFLFLFVVGMWLAGVWLVHFAGHKQGIFEALSALFSGFAFIGLIFTLIYQRQELILQREELRKSREEAHATAMANQESARIAVSKLKIDFLSEEIAKLEELYHLSSHISPKNDEYKKQLKNLRSQYKKIIEDILYNKPTY